MTRRNATSLTVAVFGCLMALAGLEHGIGEILQGPVVPAGPVFPSWPDAPFFRIVNGEPALSLLPNLLASGLATVAAALAALVLSIGCSHRRFFGGTMLGLSALLLVTGGGFGPPLIGFIVGAAGLKNRSAFSAWRRRLPSGFRRALGAAWPWLLGVALAAWLALMPGLMLADHFRLAADAEPLLPPLILAAFLSLPLVILAAYARDSLIRGR